MSNDIIGLNVPERFNNKDELIDVLSKLANASSYVFRGYNTQDQLLPNIIRGGKSGDFADVEYELLSDFEKYGSHYFSANTPIDFMSYGQHYGLPTRLLDFTYNPFIALRFALFSAKSSGRYTNYPEDADYYYIRFCKVNDNIHLKGIPIYKEFTFGHFQSDSIAQKCSSILKAYSECLSGERPDIVDQYIRGLYECDYDTKLSLEEYKKETREKIQNEKLCFIDPSQSNQRIIMQQGLFMMPYTLKKDKHIELIEKNTSALKIHKSLREPLLTYLDTLGYNAFRLMPDLASVCEAVKQKIKDERSARKELFKKKVIDSAVVFKIKKLKNGYKFDVVSSNGVSLAVSEIYETIDLCKEGISRVYDVMLSPVEDTTKETIDPIYFPKYEIHTDKVGKYRFLLKDENGSAILASVGYDTKQLCINAIDRIKAIAQSIQQKDDKANSLKNDLVGYVINSV